MKEIKMSMESDIERVLLSEDQIHKKVEELAAQISKEYQGKKVTLVSVLKGSVVFLSDLMRKITVPSAVDFIAVSSYIGSESSGVVRVTMDLRESVEDKDVILVEDILDTGLTLNYLRETFITRRVKSLKLCVLLDKPDSHKVDVPVDYLGFSIPNEFVVGYGLDYDEKYRHLPYIGILKKHVYEEAGK
jgi:hypoxanthine phosphoribosyltransferase